MAKKKVTTRVRAEEPEAQGVDAAILSDEPDTDDPDVERAEEESDEPRLVRTLVNGVAVNGHVMGEGTVFKMAPGDIDKHRAAGVPLDEVEEGYDGEVLDVSQPYVAEEKEEAK